MRHTSRRMLGILPAPISHVGDWMIVVPWHGRPSSLPRAVAETRDYLARDTVRKLAKAGGTITDATRLDQRRCLGLMGSDQLAGRNAQAVFQELEFDE